MDTKKLLLGTLVGGIVFFFLGFLFYGVLFMDFFMNNAGTATGAYKEEPDFLHLILGNLVTGLFYTYILMRFGDIGSFGDGLKAGATIGFVNFMAYNLIMLGTANISTVTSASVDTVIGLVMGGITGGVIGIIIRDKGESQAAPADTGQENDNAGDETGDEEENTAEGDQ